MPEGGVVIVVESLETPRMLLVFMALLLRKVPSVFKVILVLASNLVLLVVMVGAASPKSDNTKRQGPPESASTEIGRGKG